VNGSRRLAVQLLVKNGFEQRLKERGSVVEPECERACAVDQYSEFRVDRAQMLDRRDGIERELSAASIVNHGRSVPQARAAVRGREAAAAVAKSLPRAWIAREASWLAASLIRRRAGGVHDGDLRLAVVFVRRLRDCHGDRIGAALHGDYAAAPG